MKKSIGELAAETKLLEALLEKAAVGEVITYESMTHHIGRDVRGGARGNLYSARRRLVNKGFVFSAVCNQGLKRLSDAEIVGTSEAHRVRVVRSGTRQRHIMAQVNVEKLTAEEKAEFNARLSYLGVLDLFSKKSAQKRLSEATKNAELPPGKCLDLFK